MRDRGSHSPSGSLADISIRAVNRVVGKCAVCGAGLPNRIKKYCGPCYATRLEANIAKNRHKYVKRS